MSAETEKPFIDPNSSEYSGPYESLEDFKAKMVAMERANNSALSTLLEGDVFDPVAINPGGKNTGVLSGEELDKLSHEERMKFFPDLEAKL